MLVTLPEFRNRHFRFLAVCADIEDGLEGAWAQLGGEEAYVSGFNSSIGRIHMRLSAEPGSSHFHVDFASSRYFQGRKPKSTHTKQHIQRLLGALVGKTGSVSVSAIFRFHRSVGLRFHPTLGQRARVKPEDNSFEGITLLTSGVTVDVSVQDKTSIGSITVSLDDEKSSRFYLESRRISVRIGQNYLERSSQLVHGAMAIFSGIQEES